MTLVYNFLKPKEARDLIAFEKKHSKCYAGAIGGGLSYILTPTGLGILVSIKCNVCEQEKTLNELD